MPKSQKTTKLAKSSVQAEGSNDPSKRCDDCNNEVSDDLHMSQKHVIQPDKKALLNRLSRIGGQVNGVAQMVENDRYCVDILTQISAIRSALDSVSTQLLNHHVQGCVRRAVVEDGGEEVIGELLMLIKKMR
ncbi:DNA-binding FrmR family transcriptional regulator [Acinetobacter baylyi]|uniref:DNA-binding FrmR family transcriptional regulator n=1 Tax=Acinetobacter baylyi TaxID=202950 RepID=A0ABU0V0Q9_ACIBI|nr:metal-sensitive transcriptional regulator [Acinetobacter baylyi]MDQ1210391.1 DNA-binding FrmR family transcriptional regulator [Acinetobacter baylyi]MDR6106013.1 DNA-binding FrmR family transcriptional regulator [Acinetobacter baylyi]MDR6187263.1 DNA-binding FrmR family transcriptional regulator [Acinetobacter baylyi]